MPRFPAIRTNKVIVTYMALVHALAASALVLPVRLSWLPVAAAVYVLVGLGTTVGLHRLICHRAFACPRWVEHALVTAAMLTGQGSPLLWAATHRLHHARSDRDDDVHSPVRSLWYAHWGWIWDDASTAGDAWRSHCKDLAADRYYLWLLRFRLVPQVIAVVATGLALGWAAVPFCFFLPVVCWMHSTYAVNSFCHLPPLGYRSWATSDRSRNFWLVGLLALGEGWHNNHHAFQASARHGLRWWELDLSWWFIRGLQAAGLAWKVRLPTEGQKAARALAADAAVRNAA